MLLFIDVGLVANFQIFVISKHLMLLFILRAVGCRRCTPQFQNILRYCLLFIFRDLKELYLQFNARNGGNPSQAQIELEELIEAYRKSRHEIFREFASLLEKYKSSIINSFIMVEKIGNGRIYDSRLSNGPIESINRKIKDLKRLGRGFRNFEHFRNRFLYATRSVPVLNDITNYNPVLYLEEDDF